MDILLRIVETSPDEEREPGMMWRYLDGDKEGRECWWIVLPPNLTVDPSIDVEYWRTVGGQPVRDGSYWHGWIKERVISPA